MKMGLKKMIVAVAVGAAAASVYGGEDYLEGTIGSPGPRAVNQDVRQTSEDAQSQSSTSSKGEGRSYIPGFIKNAAASVLSVLPSRSSSSASLDKQADEVLQAEGFVRRSVSAGPDATDPMIDSDDFARSVSDMPRGGSFSEPDEEKAEIPSNSVAGASATERSRRNAVIAGMPATKSAVASVRAEAGIPGNLSLDHLEKKVSFPSSEEESESEESLIEDPASAQDDEVRRMEDKVKVKKPFSFDTNSVTIGAIVAVSLVAIVGCGAYVLNHLKKMRHKEEPIEVL